MSDKVRLSVLIAFRVPQKGANFANSRANHKISHALENDLVHDQLAKKIYENRLGNRNVTYFIFKHGYFYMHAPRLPSVFSFPLA